MTTLVWVEAWPPTEAEIEAFRQWMLANGICPPTDPTIWMGVKPDFSKLPRPGANSGL